MNEPSRLTDAEVLSIQNEFRIPVDSLCPGTYWIVSLDRESLMPTDAELRQIVSYREFVVQGLYGDGAYGQRILAKPLPKEAGHNTTIFCKGYSMRPLTETHWFWRRTTWRNAIYAPSIIVANYRGLTLIEAMDAERGTIFPERWAHWKSVNPAVFAAV